MTLKKSAILALLFIAGLFGMPQACLAANNSTNWRIILSAPFTMREVIDLKNANGTWSTGYPHDVQNTYILDETIVVYKTPDGRLEGRTTMVYPPYYNKFSYVLSGIVEGNKVTFLLTQTHEWRGVENSVPFDGKRTMNGVFTGIISGTNISGIFSGAYQANEGDTSIRFNHVGNLSGSFGISISALINYTEPAQPDPSEHNGPSPFDVGDPVNVTTGKMNVHTTDLVIPGKNMDFEFSRTYNSRDYHITSLLPDPGWSALPKNAFKLMGGGWTHNYNIFLQYNELDMQVRIRDEYSKQKQFVFSFKKGAYIPERGEHSILEMNKNGFIWTKKDGKQYLFDKKGQLTQIKDRWGNTIALIYNADDQLTSITDTAGRKVELHYDGEGRITKLSDAAGRTIYYDYDKDSNLIGVTDPAGNRTSYDYDGNMTRKTDSLGRRGYFTYDGSGYCTSSSYENNLNRAELIYDWKNNKTTVRDSKGNVSTYYYNEDKQVTKITNPQGYERKSSWDRELNKTSDTDELGRVTKMEYDAKGNLTRVIDAQGNATVYTYEPKFNLVTSIKDALGNTTANSYDTKGNLLKTTDALGSNTSYSYDTYGQLTAAQNHFGKSTYYAYDNRGDLTQTKDALGAVTAMSYDAAGNGISAQDPRGNTTAYSYDKLNHLVATTFADSSATLFSYDRLGNRTSVIDPLGKTTYYNYDQTGKVRATTDALGYAVAYDYDTEENLTGVTDQNGNRTSYSYDSLNRLTSQTDALGNTANYGYDAAGNRTSLTDAKGQTTTYEYDNLNRLVKTTYPDAKTITYTYDPLGRRLTMADWQGTTTYAYDKLGRLTKVDGPLAKDTFTYTYDALGNRLTMTDPDGKITKYSYDALNRIASITDPQNKVTTYTYDAAGNQTGIVYPNGTKAVYSYDNLNRLTTLINQKAAGPFAKISEYTYAYDAAGRRTRVNLLDGSSTVYIYDPVGQLTQESNSSPTEPYSITYNYDPAGNRTRKVANNSDSTYSYNSLNQLAKEDIRTSGAAGQKKITVFGAVSDKSFIDQVTVNGIKATLGNDSFICPNVPLSLGKNTIAVVATDVLGNSTTKVIHVTYEPVATTEQIIYTYDNNGNLIKEDKGGVSKNFTYDSQNRLVSLRGAAGDEAIYTYDGEGRRISSSLRDTAGAEAISCLYDGMSVILERNSSGATTASYIRNPLAPGGIGGIISSVAGTQQNYYHYDGIGTVTTLTNSSAAVTQAYSYDAFGNVLSQNGTAANNRKFLTKETDSTGLVFFGARYYDPRIGRFISADPSGMSDGPNVYLYALNNPVNLIDPWGLCVEVGYSPIISIGNFTIWHTFIKVTYKGQTKMMGYDVKSRAQLPLTLIGIAVPGAVKNQATGQDYKVVSRNSDRAMIVYNVIDSPQFAGQMYNYGTPNCYSWRDNILGAAGITPPNDLPWSH